MANKATASTTTSVVRYEVRISGIPTSYDAKQRVDEVLARISKFNGCFFDMCDFKMGRMATHGFLKFPGPQCASTILALVQSWGPSLDGQSWMCDLTPSIEQSRYASTSEWQERDNQPPLWHATRVAMLHEARARYGCEEIPAHELDSQAVRQAMERLQPPSDPSRAFKLLDVRDGRVTEGSDSDGTDITVIPKRQSTMVLNYERQIQALQRDNRQLRNVVQRIRAATDLANLTIQDYVLGGR